MKKNKQKIKDKHLLISYFKALDKEIPIFEIDRYWDDLSKQLSAEKSNRFRRFVLRFAQIACIAALLIAGRVWFVQYEKVKYQSIELISTISSLDQHPIDTSRQVVLVTQSDKQIEVEKGATVIHDKNGSLIVNKKKIDVSKEIHYNQLIVPKGKYSKLILADGSTLHVNAGTKVVYPNRFEKDKREIYVDGEVFIDVVRDENSVFVVKTSQFELEVLGTAFNINAYKEAEKAEIVLLRGSVAVTDQNKHEMKLYPNDLLDLINGVVRNKRTVHTDDYISWTKGRLPLSNKNIKEILFRLSLFYGCEIEYDHALEQLPLHGTIDLNVPLENVLERISKTMPITFQQTGNGYYLHVKQNTNAYGE